MKDENNRDARDQVPTPARLGMAGADPHRSDRADDHRRFVDPSTGQAWVARVSGRSSSGVAPLRIISLLEVGFYRNPESVAPERTALCRGESVGDLDEEELVRLLRDSRPYSTPAPDPPPRGRRNRRNRSG